MPKYRAKIIKTTHAYFEFEADDPALAQDHVEKLMEDYNQDPSTGYSPQNFLDFYCEPYKHNIDYTVIQAQDWKDIYA